MNPSFLLQVFLPTLVPLAAGYALRRFTHVSAQPLATVARWVLVPALLFLALLGPMAPRTSALAAGAGAGLTLAALGALALARRLGWSRGESGADAAPNVAVFALPFLVLSWDADGTAVRTAAWMFVGVGATSLAVRGSAGWAQLAREPWLYAVVAAVGLRWLEVPVRIPQHALGALVQGAYPLLLLYLGTLLHPVGSWLERRTLVTLGCRFASGAVIIVLLHLLAPLPRMAFEAAVVVALAPPAAAGAALVGESRGDEDRMGGHLVGTVASLALMLGLLLVEW